MLAVLRVLVLSGLFPVLSADPDSGNPRYVLVGSVIQLQPVIPPPLRAVLWKRGRNLLAEWDQDTVPLEYYESVRNRADLNLTNGMLRISRASYLDSGSYTVEVNNKQYPSDFRVLVLKPVPVLEVVVQPLSCSASHSSCNLTCHGDTEKVEPVSYWWRQGEGEWEESQRVLIIRPGGGKTYSCRMKNPVSENESAAIQNPFTAVSEGSVAGPVVGGIFGALVVVGLAGFSYWGFGTEPGRRRLRSLTGKNEVNSANNNSEPPTGNNTASGAGEYKPVNSKDPEVAEGQ